MNLFKSVNETAETIGQAGETYLKKSQEYYTLKVFQQLSISISLVTKVLVIGGLLFIALFFLALSFALFLGHLLDNVALGYVLTALVFLLVSGVIYLKRRFINNRVVKILSLKFFNSWFMKNYQSFEAVEADLKRLRLERRIALEEINLSKNKFKEQFKQKTWLNLMVDAAEKYGFYVLLKRFLK